MTKVATHKGLDISEDAYGRGFRVSTDRMFVDCWFRSEAEARAYINAQR